MSYRIYKVENGSYRRFFDRGITQGCQELGEFITLKEALKEMRRIAEKVADDEEDNGLFCLPRISDLNEAVAYLCSDGQRVNGIKKLKNIVGKRNEGLIDEIYSQLGTPETDQEQEEFVYGVYDACLSSERSSFLYDSEYGFEYDLKHYLIAKMDDDGNIVEVL